MSELKTTLVSKDGTTARINVSDLEQWLAQGWQETKPPAASAAPEKSSKKGK